MSFRARLVGAVTAVTVVTLGASFAAVSIAVDQTEARQLDEALLSEARAEARDAERTDANDLEIRDGPAPSADDVRPLSRYGAIYGADGAIRAETRTFGGRVPALRDIRHAPDVPFDIWIGREHLRAVLSSVPDRAGTLLLLAAPRTDLDADARFLFRAIVIAFLVAVVWAGIVATWVVRRLTGDLQRIASTALRVAEGDLSARVAIEPSDPEIARLAHDVDAMIAQLESLVTSQRRFIANAAHELRSPLTALYGELSLALNRPREAADYRRAIEDALGATQQLTRLAEDLLALARLGATRVGADAESLAVESFTSSAVATVTPEAARRGVRMEIGVNGARVRGREQDLERLVRNLLENAVRHAPDGGRVRLSSEVSDGTVKLRVEDDGPGIAPDDRARIFAPFYRGANERASEHAGAGLGLAIAREIARSHGGDVELADGDAGRGAAFVVKLPMEKG